MNTLTQRRISFIFLSLVLFLGLFVLSSSSVIASGKQWFTDLEEGLKEAKRLNKPLLADFSGSDWCGWCIRLDKEVFQQKEFLQWAKKNVVLAVADFPRDTSKITSEQLQKNRAYAQMLGVQGYPTVFLISPKGVAFARTGYQAGGPGEYIKMLEKALKTQGGKNVQSD
jgi:thioredoxin-related protein